MRQLPPGCGKDTAARHADADGSSQFRVARANDSMMLEIER
jgi:hypothetical protein